MDIDFWKAQWSEAQQSSSLAKGYNRSPNIRFFPYRWQPRYQFQELLDQYTTYFELFDRAGPEVSSRIKTLLKEREVEGFVSDCQEGVLSLIWWRPKSQRRD